MTFDPIDQMVRRSAGTFPDRVAVRGAEGVLTYAELELRASQVAGRLRSLGVGIGTVVPILAGDRRDLVTAMLGVRKAGGAFAPLDPATPARRLREILALLDPACLLVGADHPGETLTGLGATLVRVPLDRSADVADSVPSTPDDPCYVFFTSGSTGEPKGILGRLGAVDHYVRWAVETFGVEPGWRVSQLASPGFDAMLRDVFVPLSAGGTVCVPPPAVRADPPALLRWLAEERINLVHCVPSVFRGLVEASGAGSRELASLRCVALAGERLEPRDVRRWFARHGDRIRLVNMYGPSETTMTKTYHLVRPEDADDITIPVGRPMPDTEVFLLDDRGQVCGPGEAGEIHLKTAYRSLGYLNRPAETGRVFVPDPRGGETGVAYRTGDFGRLRPDGALEFLGRRDHQVKVGGVRLELEEIESTLRELPQVREAAVALVAEPEPYLCAFVELSGEIGVPDILTHLRSRHSGATLPAVVAPLAAIPRTISGKVDRRALPTARAVARPNGREVVGPRSPTERALAALVLDVMPLAEVDVTTSLLDAGGHSLLIMRLLARIADEMRVQILLQDVLAQPTVESMACLIDNASEGPPTW